jgi:hypothetical protein
MNDLSALGMKLQEKMGDHDKIKVLSAAVNALLLIAVEQEHRLDALSVKKVKVEKLTMTAKAMAAQLNIKDDHEKYMALKYFARKHAESNGLLVISNTDTKQHDQFPMASALWAMEQVGGKKQSDNKE